MKVVSIIQPAYLPWLGYFDRIAKCDLLVVLDHVEMDKSSRTKFTNRNRIRTRDAWSWLTVPVKTKGQFSSTPIKDIPIVQDSDWCRKHWNSIQANYAKSPYFEDHLDFFKEIYERKWEFLNPLISDVNTYLMQAFDISTKVVRSSELEPQKRKSDLILEICQKVDAETYISGPFGRDYLDRTAFINANIDLCFHDYPHPEYRQVFDGFEPYMSAIDLLFNHGPKSRDILLSSPDSLKSE